MKVLLFGRSGQVGWELERRLAGLGPVTALDYDTVDFQDPPGVAATIRDVAPDVIVNAAAYTAVDKAETETERARLINADAVAAMAREAAARGAWLVHYSTDYVFDGTKPDPYVETDPTCPLGVYGRTKRDGEEAVAESGCRHVILRTSWVYADRAHNFLKTILRLAAEKEELAVVADQIGAPTSAPLLAGTTLAVLERIAADGPATAAAADVSGLYHCTAAGHTSWHGFATLVVEEARARGAALRLEPENVRPIATAEWPTPARRPANSRLDTTKLAATFGVQLPRWDDEVRDTVGRVVASA